MTESVSGNCCWTVGALLFARAGVEDVGPFWKLETPNVLSNPGPEARSKSGLKLYPWGHGAQESFSGTPPLQKWEWLKLQTPFPKADPW